MKKFLTYLTIIVSVAVIGFATYYLVQDEETFYISDSVKYVVVGEEFQIDAIWENKKNSSSYEIFTLDEGIVAIDETKENTFVAVSGGVTSIYFRTTNENYRNVSCRIFVSDGTLANPYYISTADQFRAIGAGDEDYPYYTLNKSYKLLNDINLNELDENGNEVETLYMPIGLETQSEFGGTFDGSGYTISNINIDFSDTEFYGSVAQNDAGLFYAIGASGTVTHVRLNNVNILNVGGDLGNVGAVAGISFGIIERTQIVGLNIQATGAATVGGAVGWIATSEEGSYDPEHPADATYSRNYARVDRVSVTNVLFGAGYELNLETGLYEYTNAVGIGGDSVGGVVGHNHGGIIINAYAVGEVFLNGTVQAYGGVVGTNEFTYFSETSGGKYTNNTGANVKDTYASIALYIKPTFGNQENMLIGGLIGKNIDTITAVGADESSLNRIIGNYYNIELLNLLELEDDMVTPITKDFYGVGQSLKDYVVQEYEDEDYVVLGVPSVELKQQSTFKSHVETKLIFSDGAQSNQETINTWKFGLIWAMNDNINNGMPYIYNYENIADLQDEITSASDGETITTAEQLMNMSLTGNYIITKDIYLDEINYEAQTGLEWEPWTPIGTLAQPFTGSLRAATYIDEEGNSRFFKISGLVLDGTTAVDNTYGGLFGVVSGEASGTIADLLIEKMTVSGYKTVGAVAATNGFVTKDASTGNESTTSGMDIENINLAGINLTATVAVGGAVGTNVGGSINGVSVMAHEATSGIITNSSIVLNPQAGSYLAGGIAGSNTSSGVVSNSFVKSDTEISVLVENEETFIGSVGGVVGSNAGLIAISGMFDSTISISSSLGGYFGGIAGRNSGKVNEVLSDTISISAGTDETALNVYVGGLVGSLIAKGEIVNSMVTGSALSGYYLGGLVGEMQFSNGSNSLDYTFNEDSRLEENDDNMYSVSSAAVEESVLSGYVVGAIASTVQNGIISDVYAQSVTLSGVNAESKVAGVVGEIGYSSSTGRLIAGIIQNVYTVANFEGEGVFYAVSSSEFLKDPFVTSIPFTDLKFERSSGFITNVVFNDETDGSAKHPVRSNIFEDWYAQVTNWFDFIEDVPMSKSTTNEMKTRTYFSQFNFSTGTWRFSNGYYPRLTYVDAMKDGLTTSTISVNYNSDFVFSTESVTISSVEYDGEIYYSTSKLERGENLIFQILPGEGVVLSNIVVVVNGVELTPYLDVYSIYNVYEDISITVTYDVAAAPAE